MKTITGAACVVLFAALAAAANEATDRFGMVELPAGLMVTAGTFAAGAVLLVRDAINDTLGRVAVLIALAAGGAASGLTSPGVLVIASTAAFLVAELADWAVYEPMRRHGWARAVLLSSIVAGPIDTVVFLWLAPFPVTLPAVAGQWVVKTALALAVIALVKVVRGALLRNRIIARNA